MTWMGRMLTSRKTLVERAPCMEDGAVHLQGKALGQGEYSGHWRTRRIEAIRILSEHYPLAPPDFYAALLDDRDMAVVDATLASLIQHLPRSRAILGDFIKRPVDDALDQALRNSRQTPVRALCTHPGVTKLVLVHMRNMPEAKREELARKLAGTRKLTAYGFLIRYCNGIAVTQTPKRAPFLLLAEAGAPIIQSLVAQLDSDNKAHRKLALKALLAILGRNPQPQKIRLLIQARGKRLGRRGQAKIEELFRLENRSAVPRNWNQRDSKYSPRNWCW